MFSVTLREGLPRLAPSKHREGSGCDFLLPHLWYPSLCPSMLPVSGSQTPPFLHLSYIQVTFIPNS